MCHVTCDMCEVCHQHAVHPAAAPYSVALCLGNTVSLEESFRMGKHEENVFLVFFSGIRCLLRLFRYHRQQVPV